MNYKKMLATLMISTTSLGMVGVQTMHAAVKESTPLATRAATNKKNSPTKLNAASKEAVVISDKNLEKALNEKLGQPEGAPITKEQLETITDLDIDNKEIHSIDGLQYCTNLTSLRIGHEMVDWPTNESNTISDLTPLLSLQQLTSFYAAGLQITNVAPLDHLKGPQQLHFGSMTGTNVALNLQDIAYPTTEYQEDGSFSIKNPCVGLDGQPLSPSNISDSGTYDATTNTVKWTGISAQHQTVSFEFRDDNAGADGRGRFSGKISQSITKPATQKTVAEVPDLHLKQALNEELNAELINGVEDRQATDQLYQEDLAQLGQGHTQAVQHFSLANKGIRDLTGLNYCTSLSSLNLSNNEIADVPSLEALTQLKSLYLEGNQLTDIRPVFSISGLTTLHANKNKINSVKGISKLKGLTTLLLDHNCISDFSEVEEMGHTQAITGNLDHQTIEKTAPAIADQVTLKNELPLEVAKNAQVSDNGTYDETNNCFIWQQVKGLKQVSVTYTGGNSLKYSGELLVNITPQSKDEKTEVAYDTTVQPGEPGWYGVITPAIAFTDTNKASELDASVKIVNATDQKTNYTGNKLVNVKVQSTNGFELKDGSKEAVTYSITTKAGTAIQKNTTEQDLGMVSGEAVAGDGNNVIPSKASLKGPAKESGKYMDTLNYHFIEQ